MDTTVEAIASHYQELFPSLQRRDNVMFFPADGVVFVLMPELATVVTGVKTEPLLRVVSDILMIVPKTNFDKVNQRRSWLYLTKHVKHVGGTVQKFEYSDPALFTLADTLLARTSLHHT
jgi:hypothetical protein